MDLGEKKTPPPDPLIADDVSVTPVSEVRDGLIFERVCQTDSMLTQSERPNTGSSENSINGKRFGRSVDSSGSLPLESTDIGEDTVSTSLSPTPTEPPPIERLAPQPGTLKRARKSIDDANSTDHLILFGSVSASLGESRKPTLRYSGGYVFVENPLLTWTDSSELNRSADREDHGAHGRVEWEKSVGSASTRLYYIGEGKPSVSKPIVGELAARQAASNKSRSQADSPTKLTKEDKDKVFLQKRTSGEEAPMTKAPAPPSNGSGLVQGSSILGQIGTPDFNGWLMKKGEDYNTWKQRYCMLKGHNLYWMRSSDNTVLATP